MTTYFRKEVNCANCHRSSTHHVLGSTNSFGSADLDLRPPEMQRSTMRAWVQHCPHCDYCAPDLAKQSGDLSLVLAPAYQEILKDERYPGLARLFLAHAFLVVDTDLERAAFARHCAAWECDDMDQPAAARECRNLTADCLSRLKPFAENEDGFSRGIIFVDILRRAGRFAEAAAECEELLKRRDAKAGRKRGSIRLIRSSAHSGLKRRETKDVIMQVLEFESRLIGSRDIAAHMVSECTE